MEWKNFELRRPTAVIAIAGAALGLIALAPSASLAAGGEDCGTATVIAAVPFVDTGDTTGATNDGAGSCETGAATLDHFWSYTPAATGTFTMLIGGYDAAPVAFSGACGALTEDACNDTQVGDFIEAPGTMGAASTLMTGAFNDGDFGPYTMIVQDGARDAVPLANDECATATVIAALPFVGRIQNLTGGTDSGDFRGSALSGTGAVGGRDTFFTYTAAASGLLVLDLVYSDGSGVVGVWEGACGALTELAGSPPVFNNTGVTSASFPITAGNTYTIVTEDAFGAGAAPVALCLLADFSAAPPANNTCATALDQSLGSFPFTWTPDTTPNSDVDPVISCVNSSGPGAADAWLRLPNSISAANTYQGTVTVAPGSDSILEVLNGACGSQTQIACNDDTNGFLSEVTFAGMAAPNYAHIEGWSSNGAFSVDWIEISSVNDWSVLE